MQRPDHVRHALDGRIIDREQHIATCEAYNGCGSPFRDIRHHHAFRPLYPQHAIFHLAEARPRQHVGDTKAQQRRDDQDW